MTDSESARLKLVDAIRRYMVGPIAHSGRGQEVLRGQRVSGPRAAVRLRQEASELYHTGILYPSQSELDPEEAEHQENEGEESGVGDSVLSLANAMQQSAMGFTFRCALETRSLTMTATWAEYVLVERPSADDDWSRYDESNTSEVELGWKRVEFQQVIPVKVEELLAARKGKNLYEESGENGVIIHARARRSHDAASITLSIVNNRKSLGFADHRVDQKIYQARLSANVSGAEEFLKVSSSPGEHDAEAWNYELLFFEEQDFAVGHGISTSWSINDSGACRELRTEWIPVSEVFKASADIEELSKSNIFQLSLLSDQGRKSQTLNSLQKLADAYEAWIRKSQKSLGNRWGKVTAKERENLVRAADRNMQTCEDQLRRLRDAVQDLKDDKCLFMWESFCLANEAMRQSMLSGAEGKEPKWRPFQLAFILIALRSTLEAEHVDRQVLDLIWFPTGGGKTEAYLGLSCAAIFHRRLSGPGASSFGTTVVTRYTLRLLTLQQFERAAKVIFSCELLRREQPKLLGVEPISIGLYAGKDATPNKLDKAKSMIQKGLEDGASTTLPLDVCPWCSSKDKKTELTFENQRVEEGRVKTSCPNADCAFHEGMPFWCVDDEIYDYPPTFLIGTVDKFAQLTWEPRSSSLLGGENLCAPPSLIIQDELHLISDSLGSMTGLFETAIDIICKARGAKPKVVGSTATIKRAESQSRQLFDRIAKQFPPSGIVHTDSFFYREDRSLPGRLYVGVHAQGRSPKHTLPRVMALLKQSAGSIDDMSLRDKFHTLVCYFNSLRELGGALVLAQDDAPRYLEMLDIAGLLADGEKRQLLNYVEELTSNLKVREIRQLLKWLEVGLKSESDGLDPIDLVLSTNMISVGVDVDRLGCMIVNGQPKTTAEYIQASSRVGRQPGDAGLVVTLYNWTRPRDRSHYERFAGYHRAFYRHVEALTVTPFSSRARDKALHSVFFAVARHLLPPISAQDSAGNLTPEVENSLQEYIDQIVRRAEAVSGEDPRDVREELDRLMEDWRDLAEDEDHPNIVWSKYIASPTATPLLGDRAESSLRKTPLSMRDVDSGCPVMLVQKPRDAGR